MGNFINTIVLSFISRVLERNTEAILTMELLATKSIYFKDLETGLEMEFPNLIALAEWLEVSVPTVVNVLDYGVVRKDWTAERILEPSSTLY